MTLVDPNDLVEQPTWNISQTTDLQFRPGAAAYYFEQDLRTARLRGENDTGSAAGDLYTYRLDAQMRSIRATVESLRAKLQHRRIHVVATYMDNTRRFVPFMRISINDDSGSRRSDKQGYTLQGVTRMLMPGPGVGGNIATIDPPIGGGGGGGTVGGTGVELVTIEVSSATQTYTIPAGRWMVGWELQGTDPQTPQVGITAGGDELGGPVTLAASQPWAGNGNMVPSFTSTNIYFSGLTGLNTIKIWLLV